MNAIQTVLTDFTWLSLLLLAGFFIRKKVRWMQTLYLPAALIAGFIGLLLGPQVLGQISPVCLPIGDTIAKWPGVLITLVFSVQFLGAKPVNMNEAAFSGTCMAAIGHMGQIVVGLACTIGFMQFYPNLPLAFGLAPVFGFYNGHGTAAATGQTFIDMGWADGMAVTNTMATAGLISGVLIGIVMINIGVRRGYAKLALKTSELPIEVLQGYISRRNVSRRMGRGSANDVLDPFAFQLALAGFSCLCSYGLRALLNSIHPFVRISPYLPTR